MFCYNSTELQNRILIHLKVFSMLEYHSIILYNNVMQNGNLNNITVLLYSLSLRIFSDYPKLNPSWQALILFARALL